MQILLSAIANLVLLIVMAICTAAWVVALVNWDGECHCDKSECDTCPFPCEDRKRDDDGLP